MHIETASWFSKRNLYCSGESKQNFDSRDFQFRFFSELQKLSLHAETELDEKAKRRESELVWVVKRSDSKGTGPRDINASCRVVDHLAPARSLITCNYMDL